MAKVKVHELAKELDKQSKEILAFLQNKGIEAKAAQSSVEEDVADMVRKEFGVKQASEPKTESAEKKADTQEKRKLMHRRRKSLLRNRRLRRRKQNR